MISGRKLLLVTVRVVGIVSCVEIDVNNDKTFGEGIQENMVNSIDCYHVEILLHVLLSIIMGVMLGVLLLFVFLSILMIMLGPLLHRFLTCGRQGHAQGHGILSECTCADTQQISCRCHDDSLLRKLSKHLPNVDHLYDIGLHLGIDTCVIDACREDNRSITVAVFDMLRKWYQTQDGLGQNSNGLKKLKRALCRNNVGNYVQTVIQKRFDER